MMLSQVILQDFLIRNYASYNNQGCALWYTWFHNMLHATLKHHATILQSISLLNSLHNHAKPEAAKQNKKDLWWSLSMIYDTHSNKIFCYDSAYFTDKKLFYM